jgi:NodT family efflux transporter outer membrane factor (OMF) lipoprotein
MKRVALACAAVVAFAACNGTRPLPVTAPLPPVPTASGYGDLPPQTASFAVSGGAAQRFLRDMDVPGQWWALFHSPELNALIDEAITANPDVAAAQAALRSARETLYAQRSSAYPNAQGSLSVSRQEAPTFLSPPLNISNEYVYTLHTASVNVSYTPDVFGNLHYQNVSAAAAADVARFQVEETYLTLTSNVAATAVQIAGLRGQIDTTNRIIVLDRRLLNLTMKQRVYGQAAGLDVLAQESALYATLATLPPLQKQLAQQRDLLARLLGRPPGDAPKAAFDLDALHLPEELPLSLPSKLIEQRPDIAATSANLAQASADVGVAWTNRLPNFSITSQTATQALSLAALFGPGSFLAALTAAVSTTFYDHGTLKHRQAAAVANYDQAAAQYQGAVLSGFQNVADTLAALTTDGDALRAAALSDRAAQRALRLTIKQKNVGEVSALAVVSAEQAYQQAELALVVARANRYADSAALFAALGGGWWNRHETTPQN